MDKLDLEKRILENARRSQLSILDTLEGTARERLRNINDSIDDDQGERYESNREEELDSVSREANQVETARDQLTLLERIHVGALQDEIGPGAVVLTDFRNFLVATSLTDFDVEGTNYLGISPQSSIYQSLKGKRKGDTFAIGNATHRILDVF